AHVLLGDCDVCAGAGAADFQEPASAVGDDAMLGRRGPLRLLEEPTLTSIAIGYERPVRADEKASRRRAGIGADVSVRAVQRVRPHAVAAIEVLRVAAGVEVFLVNDGAAEEGRIHVVAEP